ncbi:DUF86 domain-containing protein [Candidatus Sumerlaeota bacterium]|nr:DUF86 domain-containing protein [Candidatus Sumerlaeota bacterium]
MSERDDIVGLRHMLDHAREAVELSEGRTREDLRADRMLQLALTRLVEVVGEAATRVSTRTRVRHSSIAWTQIVSMRNRLIHGYDILDWNLLWDTVCEDLPPLISGLESILESEEAGA